jgi:hypothetical protein
MPKPKPIDLAKQRARALEKPAVIDAHLELVPAEPAPLKPGHVRLASLADLDALSVAPADPWQRAREYVRGASMAAKMTVAFQVLTGFELIALKKQAAVQHGGDRKSSAKDSHLITWEDLVKSELGIGKDTARTWMKMAEAIRPRLKKLGGSFEALPMLELAPAQWNDEQRDTLAAAVKKATDGKTQLDFLEELGLAKKPQGSGGKGGAKPAGAAVQIAPEQAAIDTWTPTIKAIEVDGLHDKTHRALPDSGAVSLARLKGAVIDLLADINELEAKRTAAMLGKKGAKAK